MARMNWGSTAHKPWVPVITGLKTFCSRCGKEFVPLRRHHRRCSACA